MNDTITRQVEISVLTDNGEHLVGHGSVLERYQAVTTEPAELDQHDAVRLFVRWYFGLADDAEISIKETWRYATNHRAFTVTFTQPDDRLGGV